VYVVVKTRLHADPPDVQGIMIKDSIIQAVIVQLPGAVARRSARGGRGKDVVVLAAGDVHAPTKTEPRCTRK
jgi:hypothetical protein